MDGIAARHPAMTRVFDHHLELDELIATTHPSVHPFDEGDHRRFIELLDIFRKRARQLHSTTAESFDRAAERWGIWRVDGPRAELYRACRDAYDSIRGDLVVLADEEDVCVKASVESTWALLGILFLLVVFGIALLLFLRKQWQP